MENVLQHIILDLRVGRITYEGGHVKFLQREVHIDIFAVNLSLGKSDNAFYMGAAGE